MNELFFEIVQPENHSGKFIAGKARPRVTKKGWAYNKGSEFEKTCKSIFRQRTPKEWQKSGIFGVKITCFFALEKTNNKRENAIKSGNFYTKKPDLDNIAKGVLDCMNGIVFDDDNAVSRLFIEKYYQVASGEKPLVIVNVERLSDKLY